MAFNVCCIGLWNKILFGPYLQFNSLTTLPSDARLLSMPPSRGQRKLHGKRPPWNGPTLLFWLLYHLLFPKAPVKTKCLSPNCPPSSSCLASRCPHWYKLASLCVGTNRCSLTALSGWYFCLTLTPHLKYCVKKGRRFVHKRHMTTTPSCQCPRLSQILSLSKLNFPEGNWNTFLHKNCCGASASIVKKRAVHIIFPYQVGQFDACNISLILACVKMVLMIYIWSHSLIVRNRQR